MPQRRHTKIEADAVTMLLEVASESLAIASRAFRHDADGVRFPAGIRVVKLARDRIRITRNLGNP